MFKSVPDGKGLIYTNAQGIWLGAPLNLKELHETADKKNIYPAKPGSSLFPHTGPWTNNHIIRNIFDWKKREFLVNPMPAILNFRGQNEVEWHKNNVRIGILVVKLLLKEISHKFLGGLVQKLFSPISAEYLVDRMVAIFTL